MERARSGHFALTATEQGKVWGNMPSKNGELGYRVALSGDTAIVGAREAAFVFVRSGVAWSLQQKLTPADGPQPGPGREFGSAVAMSGDTALVGAWNDEDNGTRTGAVYAFVRSGTMWTEVQKLYPQSPLIDAWFGISIAMSADTAVIGAPRSDDQGEAAGACHVFTLLGGLWNEEQKLVADDGAPYDQLGAAVALSGDTAVVSSYESDEEALNAGAAYVFQREAGLWTAQQKLTASDAEAYDHLGSALAIQGDTALVAAYDDDGSAGSVYVFSRTGAAWTEEQKLVAADRAPDDWFGEQVAISGLRVLIGADGDDDLGSASGAVYTFMRGATAWSERAKIVASDGAAEDWFGVSVALEGSTAVVGAVGDDDNGVEAGAAYLLGMTGDLGDPCGDPGECTSGFCADGVCCDSACDADACDVCAIFAGSPVDGACSPIVCAAGDACHVPGTCDSALGCSKPVAPDGASCDDGDACTSLDSCEAGICQGAGPVVCAAEDDCHNAGVCDPSTGACSQPAKEDGVTCSEGTCESGACVPPDEPDPVDAGGGGGSPAEPLPSSDAGTELPDTDPDEDTDMDTTGCAFRPIGADDLFPWGWLPWLSAGAFLRRRRAWSLGASALLFLSGCSGDGARSPGVPPPPAAPAAEGLAPPIHVEPGPTDPGRVTVHRLNRTEYNNTAHDLMGTSLRPADAFASDDPSDGFDNLADALTISPVQLELYVRAAEILAAEVFAVPQKGLSEKGEAQNKVRERILTCDPALEGRPCAREVVAALSRRAYRRAVSDVEIDRVMELVDLAASEGESVEQGLELAVTAILASPHFLFRVELDPDPTSHEPHALTDYELASRMSYFLWSSMPDDQLLATAEVGALGDPETLSAEAERMLARSESDALIDNFAGQWLGTRALSEHQPDAAVYPAFDEALRDAMGTETALFMAELLRGARPVQQMLTADFTFLDARLATHYGLAAPASSGFQLVTLASPDRGGILTQASVLTVTSHPARTSPVRRGKWILAQLLCSEPPAPPADVEAFVPEAAPTGTIKDQLAQHVSSPSCASCHKAMDPLGYGLERYDGVGASRTHDQGYAVDDSGALPSGESFEGAHELSQLLALDGRFTPCVTEKLLTYALGRSPSADDEAYVERLARDWDKGGSALRDLVLLVVQSEPFRMRRGESALPSRTPPMENR